VDWLVKWRKNKQPGTGRREPGNPKPQHPEGWIHRRHPQAHADTPDYKNTECRPQIGLKLFRNRRNLTLIDHIHHLPATCFQNKSLKNKGM
jgi:hypothetical protein